MWAALPLGALMLRSWWKGTLIGRITMFVVLWDVFVELTLDDARPTWASGIDVIFCAYAAWVAAVMPGLLRARSNARPTELPELSVNCRPSRKGTEIKALH